MKTMFDNMITIIIMIVFLFVLTSFAGVINVQISNARSLHASAISQLQSSHYTLDIEILNNKIKTEYPNWNLSVEEIKSVNARKDYIVRLNYDIVVPIFNLRKEATLEGYAR